MTEVLLKRAREVVAKPGEACDPARTCLFICGHGTSMNDNSTKIIYEQAEAIRAKGIYADCQPVLMEQQPFVKDWRTLTDCPDVIVVPFFISDGLHSFEDIPVLLGMTHNVKEKGFANPHRENGRRLWYATAIGTEPDIADLIIKQVEQSEASLPKGLSNIPESAHHPLPREFLATMKQRPTPWLIGQVFIEQIDGNYVLRHVEDRAHPPSELKTITSPAEIRELILRDEQGHFRPLRAAPNLRRGWILATAEGAEVMMYLDYFYPAEAANWALRENGALPVTPWHETAERQTGRFRIVREIDEVGVRELAAQVCDRGCLKRRLWAPCAQQVAPAPNEIPLLCPEACNYFVSKAREKLKGVDENPD
jgi:sirohydrochlorin cobaltochelatase